MDLREATFSRVRMRLLGAVLLATLLASLYGGNEVEARAPAFRCTRVIGFSQTEQWFLDPAFEAQVGTERWELLAVGGGSVTKWADPGFSGWRAEVKSPCRSGRPDRVLLTITANPHGLRWLAGRIRATVAVVRARYGLRDVLLQPVVGGPNDSVCRTRSGSKVSASANHRVVDQAIALVLADGDPGVAAGASPVVAICAHYRDGIGHLSREGRRDVAQRLGAYYRDR